MRAAGGGKAGTGGERDEGEICRDEKQRFGFVIEGAQGCAAAARVRCTLQRDTPSLYRLDRGSDGSSHGHGHGPDGRGTVTVTVTVGRTRRKNGRANLWED